MTLVIGIKCEDGIVMASDGAATLGTPEAFTTRQEVKKLKLIQNKVIVGTSGAVGMGQRFSGELEECYTKKEFSGAKPFQALDVIQKRFKKYVEEEQRSAQHDIQLIGARANSRWMCSSVIALPVSRELCLFEFSCVAPSEEKTFDLPFVAIGSGQNIADPFLAFIRRLLWEGNHPKLSQGIFAAVWTVTHAIRTSPGGVSEPIQVAILKKSNGDATARELSDLELREHQQAVEEFELTITDRSLALDEPTQTPPTPPAE